jgi:hypothetical protein
VTLATLTAPDEPARRLHESADDRVARLLNEASSFLALAVDARRHGDHEMHHLHHRSSLRLIHEAQTLMQREAQG